MKLIFYISSRTKQIKTILCVLWILISWFAMSSEPLYLSELGFPLFLFYYVFWTITAILAVRYVNKNMRQKHSI